MSYRVGEEVEVDELISLTKCMGRCVLTGAYQLLMPDGYRASLFSHLPSVAILSTVPDNVAIEAQRLAHACHAAEALRGTVAPEHSSARCHFAARVAQLCGVHLPAGIQLRGPAEDLWNDRSVKAAVGRFWTAVSSENAVTKQVFLEATSKVASGVLDVPEDSPEVSRVAEVRCCPVRRTTYEPQLQP